MSWALLGLVPLLGGGGWAAFRWLRERQKKERELSEWEWRAREEALGEEAPGEGPEEPWKEDEAWAANLTREAAVFCQAGHEGGGVKLNLALKAAPAYAPARLMRACWHMQAGRWDSAREDLAFASIRDTPEARLLLELAHRLPHAPGWRHAFFQAWLALGTPDFRDSPLLPPPLDLHVVLADTAFVWQGANETLRFPLVILNLALAQVHQEWVLEQVRTHDSVPLLMALREHLLALDAQAPLFLSLMPAVEARLGQLAGDAPPTLQLALVSFLAGQPPTAPFERRDLEVLERLVALPEWKRPSSEQVFLELNGLFDDRLLAPRHHAWLLASSAQALSLAETLYRRGKASRERLTEDEQHWMGRLLWEVGARLRGQRSHLELDRGLHLQILGSELTGHGPTRMECISAWMELGLWEEALARAAVYRWPLASLQEEACAPRAHHEHAWMKAFAVREALP